jgi:hypothetical protein
MITLAEMRRDHPEKAALISKGLAGYGRWVARRAVHKGRPRDLLRLAALAATRSPALGLAMLLRIAPGAAWEMLRWRYARPQAASAAPATVAEPAYPYPVGSRFITG